MDKSRITAAIWPRGTGNREQMEIAAKEIHDIGYVSFHFHLRFREEEQIFANFDKELEFCAELGLKRICLQATSGRPYKEDVERMDKYDLDYELDLIGRFAEKTKE